MGIANSLETLTALAVRRGHFDTALAHLREAIAIQIQIGDKSAVD